MVDLLFLFSNDKTNAEFYQPAFVPPSSNFGGQADFGGPAARSCVSCAHPSSYATFVMSSVYLLIAWAIVSFFFSKRVM